jgi:agmatinase/guanidinopropionase
MEYKQLSGRELPRFSGLRTFFRLPHVTVDQDYEVGIFGIPFDGAVSYRPGARFAPTQIRDISALGRGFHWSRALHVFNTLKVADIGDCPTVPIDQEQTYQRIQNFVGQVLQHGKRFVAIGGDHSITLPILREVKKHYQQPVRLIHFDAHLDTYPAAWGCEYHHGTFVRHAVNEGLIDPKQSLQIGIRGPLAGADDLEFVRQHGIQVMTMDDIRSVHLNEFVKKLPEFSGPTYLTFDIDSMDPSCAPGTGTPVPGGLTSYEVQQILRSLRVKNLVGGDIVEVLPAYDHAQLTSLVATDVLFEILCLMAAKN